MRRAIWRGGQKTMEATALRSEYGFEGKSLHRIPFERMNLQTNCYSSSLRYGER